MVEVSATLVCENAALEADAVVGFWRGPSESSRIGPDLINAFDQLLESLEFFVVLEDKALCRRHDKM